MLVQNANSKISACPDLATNLLQILVPTTFTTIAYCVKKHNLHFSYVIEEGLLRKNLVISKKSKVEFSMQIFACPRTCKKS